MDVSERSVPVLAVRKHCPGYGRGWEVWASATAADG
jgi:hypothetical protein